MVFEPMSYISSDKLWLLIGFIAQSLFFSRFIVQWIVSEKHKKSIIPNSFWYLSIAGNIGLLVYSIHIKDPVFILANSFNCIIYVRNIVLIKKQAAVE